MANDLLNVRSREVVKKSVLSSTRREGGIPGVYYSSGDEPELLLIEERELLGIIASGNVIINMKMGDDDAKKVVIKEVQIHPVTDKILHVDLMGIRMDKEIEVQIPIHFEGTPEGVKLGGLQQSTLRELTLRGLPGDIPEVININVENLDIGDSIHVSEISLPKIFIVTEAELAIVSVVTPKIVEEVVPEEELEELEGEEGEEGEEVEGEEGKEGAEKGEKEESHGEAPDKSKKE